MSEYLSKITAILQEIEKSEAEKLEQAKELVASVIENDGLVFTFGCGHSHLPGLDAFYRAGGLANVSPMLDTDLMLHNGAAKSSRMEKISGIGGEIVRRYNIDKEKDMLVVFSVSGKNAVPVEVATAARNAGIRTVTVTSSSYYDKGARLHELGLINIDCHCPYGDASIDVGEAKMGGLSTYTSCFILNTILIGGALRCEERGVKPPVFISGNIEGGKEHNVSLEEKYIPRVKHL